MTNTTNTANAISNAAHAAKAAPARKSPAAMMTAIVQNDATMKILEASLKENAGAFAASVIDLYNTDSYLQQCDPKAVFGECLKAVSLKLPIVKGLGFAYIVPYKGVPQFQIGYKGLIQLAMRTGAYKYINAGSVYEGELKSVDKLTGDVDLSGEAVSDKVIGYFAYMETLNGFRKALYWSKEKSVRHAAKFSKSYNSGSAIWKEHADEMFTKQVLRNLLSKWGVLSVEMVNAFSSESEENTALADQRLAENDIVDAEYSVEESEGINE
ncbi:MAG: recombinase RecT [Clostridiales bacterium]|nr:recombinase RecT [Clostridiales bacterium]